MVHVPSLIGILIIGALAGWLAGLIVRGHGFGILGNIVVGIIGAIVGSFLLGVLHVFLVGGFLAKLVGATLGAVVLLILIGLVRRA
ncbi:MAG: GlsB/YeaQ/YmgE family stress response membrane protein [Rhodospirillales bacterium]|nr:GlsB/YeaQ/YmgE family stress response membrane protein [Rhodospirillales bacterium]